jgi:hypothetical protein
LLVFQTPNEKRTLKRKRTLLNKGPCDECGEMGTVKINIRYFGNSPPAPEKMFVCDNHWSKVLSDLTARLIALKKQDKVSGGAISLMPTLTSLRESRENCLKMNSS